MQQIKNSAADHPRLYIKCKFGENTEKKGVLIKMRNKVKMVMSAVLAVCVLMGLSFGTLAGNFAGNDGQSDAEDVMPVTARTDFSGLRLIAAGTPFGVKFHTEGVVVVGICGNCGPAADAGLKKGDVITAVDGKKIDSVTEFAEVIRHSGGKAVKLEYKSGGLTHTAEIEPISDENGEYKLGVWIKDSAAGIGTVTFIEPKTMAFAGLGHGICDAESGELVPFAHGSAEEVALSGITPGRAGTPGELRGSFTGRKMGKLLKKSRTPKEWLGQMRDVVEHRGQNRDMDNYSAIAVMS